MNNKSIDLIKGIVKVDVNKELDNKFKLKTPNLELSCNECSFWAISDMKKGDSFYHISGMMNITNLFDTEYELIQDFPMPGRNWQLSLTKILN